ncbi:Uncharacterized protein YP598_0741 [Yersinia pseudotuberculosis]|uniref:Uncharacterized protein n=1 Tax=Yersinia pseudotuberculosis serotype O:1b (strain IP 31758) TaxID=349747 RepID=A0A0U1QXX2_YERP3|nr:hypothetical protein YpsIP31758_0717 [Yersinia pseudotuberculosis IP 31758]UFA60367.1 Uncharacterized protein YP598_0741 [Yersinia pseudotuberculosis]
MPSKIAIQNQCNQMKIYFLFFIFYCIFIVFFYKKNDKFHA